jgi:hypothetical protein
MSTLAHFFKRLLGQFDTAGRPGMLRSGLLYDAVGTTEWHQLLVRCSALEMYLLLTPVDNGKSIEMTLFDIKGRDKETDTFPFDTSPIVLWKTADE